MSKKSQTADEDHPHDQQADSFASSPHTEHEAVFPPVSNGDSGSFGEVKNDDIAAKAATIAVVGVGVALISAELLPGMLIGVAAAFLPGIGPKLRPFFRATVRAGYSAVRKTREVVAEAGEQIQDIVAEAKSEKVPPVPTPPDPHTVPHA
ncbi:MAG: DUF5132 domain-containing protein [Acidobacteriaceae bacterium]|nr:DUF5132 domain-containing protein [Acidobacteriaceae bacterium]